MIRTPPRPVRGFTLVEVLVVLGIVVLLVGLLAVGLQTAGRTARKTRELNTGRQIGLAWQQYSSTYESRLLPGWIDVEVQEAWKVRYKDSGGDRVDPEFCRSYPWRLLPFLSYDFETLYGYLERDAATWSDEPALVSENPAFGLNAYYVGGWWEPFSSGPDVPLRGRPVFASASYETADGRSLSGRLVNQTQESIKRPSQLIVFAASGYREPGFYKEIAPSASPGAAWVVPPRLGTQPVWELSYGDQFQTLTVGSGMLASLAAAGIEVFQTQAVPVARHKQTIASVRADLSTSNTGLGEMMDMAVWIDPAFSGTADGLNFTHTDE